MLNTNVRPMLRRVVLCLAAVGLMGCGNGRSGTSKTVGVSSISPPEGSRGYGTLMIPGLGPQRVPYVVKDGLAISGDVVLSPAQLEDTGAATSAGESPAGVPVSPVPLSVARANSSYRWPAGQIPVQIDRTTIPVGSGLDTVVQGAIASWQQHTPITFPTYGGSGDFLQIQATLAAGTGGLSSSVGRLAGTGQHTVSLATDVGCCQGVVTHELGHIIGLYHEQQRADRDQYVKVYDGISPVGCSGGACLPNHFSGCSGVAVGDYMRFANESQGAYGNDGTDLLSFDFKSIMIYAGDTTGCCGLPCMTDLNGNAFPSNQTASTSDLAAVSQIYYELAWGKWIATAVTDVLL